MGSSSWSDVFPPVDYRPTGYNKQHSEKTKSKSFANLNLSGAFHVRELELAGWKIEFDREATVAAHNQLTIGGPESCTCDYCRNWAQTRLRVLPASFQQLLERLGIPLDRECEVYQCAKLESGLHLYGGWYHFVGRVVKGEREGSSHVALGTFSVFFASKPDLLPRAFVGFPVVQLGFEATIPWLSDIPELG